MKSIAVFCGSSESNDNNFVSQAYNLGSLLASQKIDVVYGAAKIGLMGHVAKGALDQGGRVIGIIPEFLTDKEVVHLGLTELIVLDTMHQRKAAMNERADGFIVLPGGFGTLEEFFEVLTWAQLGLHSKPIGILNTNGFYDPLMDMINTMVDKDLLKLENQKMILISNDVHDLLSKMKNYIAPEVPKWLSQSKS